MVGPSITALNVPLLLAAGALGVYLAPWLLAAPRLAVVGLLAALVAGQTARLPLPGQGGGLLVSDIAILFVLLTAVIQLYREPGKIPSLAWRTLFLVLPFIIWSLFTLGLQAPALGSNTLIAAAYWGRLAATLLLLPALLLIFRRSELRLLSYKGLLAAASVLAAIGLVQVVFVPDLTPYTVSGWDPHQWRVVSTWLDPNFFGAFLVLMIPVTVAAVAQFPARRLLAAAVIVQALALLLTQSRSAAVAFAVAAVITLPLAALRLQKQHLPISPALAVSIIGFITLIVLVGATLFPQRALGLITFDSTVQLRLQSIRQAWQLAQDHSVVGVGYNAYQFAARDAGFISDFTHHSRAGADNSFLTIWATTGLAGLLLFLMPWVYCVHQLLNNPSVQGFAALTALLALLINAQFINSLLYAHLLISIIVILAVVLSVEYDRARP